MADDDPNLPAAYDLVPVDHTPQFADAPIPKAGQTVQQPNVMGDISSMPGKVASAVGDVTGVSDAYKAATGQMTPDEAQMFALGALPALIGGPEAKAASEAAPIAARLFSDIRPAAENLAGVVDSNFLHGRVIGDQTVPISSLVGGTTTDATDAARVARLSRQMSSPSGYIERPIVDDVGNVIEGQHRLDALRQLGIDQVPVTVIKDLSRGYDTDAMKAAIKGTGWVHSDNVHQLVDHALNAIHDEGSPKAAAANTSIGGQWEAPYQAAIAAAQPKPQGIRAFHGSPYDFNQFDLSKIGTGEGAQAYGHGLYFAENPATAQDYKSKLSTLANVNDSPEAKTALYYLQQNKFDKPAAIADLQSRLGTKLPDSHPQVQAINNYDPGKMYEVNINADPEHFLDWDKPLSEQHPKVQEALQKVGVTVPKPPDISTIPDPAIRGIVRKALRTNEGQAQNLGMIIDNDQGLYNSALQHAKNRGRDLDAEDERAGDYVTEKAQSFLNTLHHAQTETPASFLRRAYDNPMFAGDVVGKDQASPSELSQALADKGIPGIKYLDQGSRNATAGGEAENTALRVLDAVGGNRQKALAEIQSRLASVPPEARSSSGNLQAAHDLLKGGWTDPRTKNYVVFNDKLIDIVKKYGLAGLVAGGASHFSTVPVDHQPDFGGQQQGMADGGSVDDIDAPNSEPSPPPNLLEQAQAQYPVLKGLGYGYVENFQPNAGFLEHWEPGDKGVEPADPQSLDRLRPDSLPLDQPGLEIRDPTTRPIDILGDIASHHLINTDPVVKKAYQGLQDSLTQDQESVLQNQYQYAQTNEGETGSYGDWKQRVGMPGLFRGYTFQQWPKEFTDKHYTPEQRANLDNLMKYFRGETQPQKGMATGGSVKATKTQANYRGGTAKKRCGICDMFVAPSGCTAVRGVISPQALCDFYERAKDLKTLYVMRPLLNAGDVIAWAKSQGFKKAVGAGDMHVTIAFSREKVAHDALKPERGTLVASGSKRTVKPLGDEGAVVLTFESSELSARWKAFREIGASWDYDSYHPHVTITYDGEGMDLKGIKPYTGPLRFGPEKFSELDEGWKDKITERASGGRVNGVKIDAAHDGPWMSCMSIDGSTMYRNKNIPNTANVKGKTVDVDDMLLHHEVPERADLEKLIAEFKERFHREPNTRERKGIYLKAHNRSGTPNERAHAKKIGVDWKAWSAWCRGEESKIEKMKFTNEPKDADVKPIPHSHGDLEAEDRASAA